MDSKTLRNQEGVWLFQETEKQPLWVNHGRCLGERFRRRPDDFGGSQEKGDGGFNEDSVGENTNGWAHVLEVEWVGMLIIWMREGKDKRKPLPFLALVTRC